MAKTLSHCHMYHNCSNLLLLITFGILDPIDTKFELRVDGHVHFKRHGVSNPLFLIESSINKIKEAEKEALETRCEANLSSSAVASERWRVLNTP